MLIFKFGGISVKSAKAVTNITNIISNTDKKLVVVVSAMGKMTNRFEDLINSYFKQNSDLQAKLSIIKQFHLEIINELFDKKHQVFTKFTSLIAELETKLNETPSHNYDYEYDKIIIYGELLSTTIISEYLNLQNIKNQFIDIRKSIITDGYFRDGRIIWDKTEHNIVKIFNFKTTHVYITQGFIASDEKQNSVSLGREGSDFSASILAFCLNAKSVTIWKDVPGILNADPRIFDNTEKIDKLSYKESVELAYYGAQVIHPKTIKPLENKNIPLFVKSFFTPQKSGTLIANFAKEEIKISSPIIIIKENQALISISPRDFSFIEERNISKIFKVLDMLKIKVNLMENSAVSFSVVIDNTEKAEKLLLALENDFITRYNTDLQLITIRHYNKQIISELLKNKKILLEQKSRNTVRFAVKN